MSLTPAEQKVRKLARLGGNCVCANCGTEKKFGFSTVCIKFHTFVCNNCKSSHQAISHRCKSLTMSSWTDAEVAELQRKGNDYARRTWLKNAPPIGTSGRPREGDDVNVFKRFVVQAYEHKRYYGEDDGTQQQHQGQVSAPSNHRVAVAVPLSAPRQAPPLSAPRQAPPLSAPRQAPKASVPKPSPAPAPPVADLLDFASPLATPQSTGTNVNAFQPNFDAFGASSTVQAAPPAASGSANMFDPNFDATAQGQSSAPVQQPAPAASGFSFISQPQAAAPVTTTSSPTGNGLIDSSGISATSAPTPSAFADFSAMSSTLCGGTVTSSPSPASEPKKQVMSNMSLSTKSNAISCMDMPPTKQKGSKNNGMMAQGYNMQQQQQMNMMQQQQMRMMQQQQQQAFPMMGMQMAGGMNNPMMYQQQQMAMMQNQRAMQQNMMPMGNTGMGSMGMNMNMNMNTMSSNSGGVDPFMSLNSTMMGAGMKKK